MDVGTRDMSKAAAMDKLMEAYDRGISSSEVLSIIQQSFQLDLEAIQGLPICPRAALDAYLSSFSNQASGPDIRSMINEAFGINLDALSALAGGKISIFSKNQWMLQDEKDLFVVYTSAGDVNVKIVPTDYFIQQTGSEELPIELRNALAGLGYDYEESIGGYYYANPANTAVSDAFKGQTMMAIRKVIQQSFSHL